MFWSCFSSREYPEHEWTAVLYAETLCVSSISAHWHRYEGLPFDKKLQELRRFLAQAASSEDLLSSSAPLDPSWFAGFLKEHMDILENALARLPEDYGKDGKGIDGTFFTMDFQRYLRCGARSPDFVPFGMPGPVYRHTGFKQPRRTSETRGNGK